MMLNLLCLSISAQEKKASEKSRYLSPSEIVDSLKKNSYAIMLVRDATQMRATLQDMCSDTTDVVAHKDSVSRLQGGLADFPADSLLQMRKRDLEALRDSLNVRLAEAQKRRNKETNDTLQLQLSECQVSLDSLSETLADLDSLKGQIALWEGRLNNVLAEREKAEADLRLLTDRKGMLDTCVVRTALAALEKPYDEEIVKETITQFELIHPDLQTQLSELLVLLKKYGGFYEEYRQVLMDLQYDPAKNVFETEAYSNKWTTKVKNLSYYKTYYAKGWNIPYLDAKYKDVMSRINANKKAKKKAELADFTDLINE